LGGLFYNLQLVRKGETCGATFGIKWHGLVVGSSTVAGGIVGYVNWWEFGMIPFWKLYVVVLGGRYVHRTPYSCR
jgi:hypothetical protein